MSKAPGAPDPASRRRVPDGIDPRTAGSALAADAVDSSLPERIGQKIREVRLKRGMTAKELASDAGVTPAMISQVEGGTVSPSIATLLRIAGALHVSVGELFDQQPVMGRVMRVSDRVLLAYPDSGVRDEIISADPTGNLQVFWCELAVGATSGEEPLEHGSEVEFALVLAGRVSIDLGAETVVLEPGETVTFSGRVPHSYRNDNDGPSTLIWVTTPASF
jgi:transcriptional regulator with XRE-family HTH domain